MKEGITIKKITVGSYIKESEILIMLLSNLEICKLSNNTLLVKIIQKANHNYLKSQAILCILPYKI